ncbi:apolipoprotein N-acyltransferase [Uliginosibacterium sp. H1]|uniref:apolipoprotein N-acyltransferase n=1 Tax=Uliginosibacterium sp. H1 TaxID=3114757 RepID=UPI002E180B66|nr:apolipoprotein N-acyltransferase [Uliginosibacterium sp. H1]
MSSVLPIAGRLSRFWPRSEKGRLLLALGSGVAMVFAYAPFGQSWLAPLGWLVLWGLCDGSSTARRAAAAGFAWGLGFFAAGLGWMYVALNVYGGMAPPLAALSILLLCAYLSLFTALAGWLMLRLRSGRPVWDAALAAAAYMLGEWLRGNLFTGLPWLMIGYTQAPPSPLAGWAPVLGVYGVSMLLVFVVALVGQTLRGRLRWPLAAAAVVTVLAGGVVLRGVAWTQPEGAPLKVALLQTNIPQDQKWDMARVQDWLALNADMVRQHARSLVVLPETTLPMFDEQLPAGYLDHLGALARAAGGDVVLGIFTRDEQGRVFNSAISRGSSPAQHYGKNHLVPFGEFQPPGFRWFFSLAKIPMADQSRGGATQPPLQLGDQRIAMNICYEDVFGEELLHALPEATLMLNISNLAWYGNSHAQPQHLQIAQWRALETGRPMLRATNTGMTALVAPDGSVSAVLPAFTRGALEVEVQGHRGLTPYALWGNTPFLAMVACILVAAVTIRRRSSLRQAR